MENDDEDPPVWLTVIKLVVVAVVLIGETGLALWYVDQAQTREQPGPGSGSDLKGWGIVTDNPLRRNR